jgi:hypothetical protein
MNRKSISLFLPGLLLLTVGCGSKGTITGAVSYQGKPISSGSIIFVPENGTPSVTAPIVDGSYSAEKVPPGPAKVGVTSFYVEPNELTPMQRAMQSGRGGPPPDAPEGARKAFENAGKVKQGIKIPDNYADPEKSTLTYTVKGGSQKHDIDLK